MKPYLLGIDIGTSACKVAVFEKSGTVWLQPMVIIRFIIRKRAGQSRIRKNGGVLSVRRYKESDPKRRYPAGGDRRYRY